MGGGTHVRTEGTDEYPFCDAEGNVYTKGMEFGSSTSDLRWVWLYTCNFLTTGEHVTNDSLREMMNGAHIVMGYASQSKLCDPNASKFAEYLREGRTIIDAFFLAGYTGEATSTNDHHIQKVLYIPQARNETIYSPYIKYQYDVAEVSIIIKDIQDPYF